MGKMKELSEFPENVELLLEIIKEKRKNWDERSQFKIMGVSNLSQADLDTIKFYCNAYIKTGGHGLGRDFMKPLGDVKKVLELFNIETYTYADNWWQ